MNKILGVLKLLRMHQWYKNFVIFLPIFFDRQLFNTNAFLNTIIGFAVLCMVSSANYAINDITDLEKDKLHPEKRKRPLASGQLKVWHAALIAVLFLAVGLGIGWKMSSYFTYSAAALFVLTQLYSFWLKNIPFADILLLSTNFVVRAVAGVFLVEGAKISPWLVLCPFFLALFLATSKRNANVRLLKKGATQFRKSLGFYSPEITNSLMILTTTCLVIFYALYVFLNYEHVSLIFTLPFAFFVIFRYFYLVYSDSEIPAEPHKVIKDAQMVIGILLWLGLTFVLLYFKEILGLFV